jgi:hypothetical protein
MRICLLLSCLQAHLALNTVVQVLDRKKFGRCPKNVHVLDIPAQYLCVRKDGTTKWVPGRSLTEPEDLKLLRKHEWRFTRSKTLPCDFVSQYPLEKYADERERVSEDELDIRLWEDLNQRYGR